MFVGGCTMAEVAALRFLSQQVSHFLLLFFLFDIWYLHIIFVGHNTYSDNLIRRKTMWSIWWRPRP